MESTVSYLLMLQQYINLSKIFRNKNQIHCLHNIPIDFTLDNMKKTGLKRNVKVFSVDYNSNATKNTLDW